MIRRGDIPGLFTPGVMQAIRLYVDWKNDFGLPYSGAWLEQPWIVNTILRTLNAEYGKHTRQEREERKRG